MTSLVMMIMPLVGGYWFLSNCNRTKYMAYGYTGYRLFLGSAFFGLVFLFLAKSILSAISPINSINYIISCISEWFIPTGFNLEATLAMIIGIASPYALNRLLDKHKWANRAAMDRGDVLHTRIYKAISNRQTIEIMMQNGDVHIGFISKLEGLDIDFVDLIPLASGYRDEKTKDLVIKRDYSNIMIGIGEKTIFSEIGINHSNLSITLKMSDISAAQYFYPEVYAEFERLRRRSNAQS